MINDLNMEKEQVQEKQSYSFEASKSTDETELGSYEIKDKEENKNIPGPSKVIGAWFKSLFASIIDTCKKPIKLIPAIVLFVVWFIISFLRASDINPMPVRVLSFLTFAEGGLHGGFIGVIGGLIGKGLFACAVVIIISLFKKKEKGEKRSLTDIILGSFGVNLNILFAYLTGIGASMLLFLFISGGATKVSFMGGMAVMFLSAFSALNGGFIPSIINAFTSKGKTKATETGVGFTRGLALGFLVSALIGLIGINLILIITGFVLVLVGIVMMILQKKGIIKLEKGDK